MGNEELKTVESPEEYKGRYTLKDFKRVNDSHYETNVYDIWTTQEWNQLTVKRKDDKPIESWYDLWNIKNKVWGENITAIEIYPSRNNLIDGQNQRHLFKIKNSKNIDFSNASDIDFK